MQGTYPKCCLCFAPRAFIRKELGLVTLKHVREAGRVRGASSN